MPENEEEYVCDVCGARFKSHRALMVHYSKTHTKKEEPEEEKQEEEEEPEEEEIGVESVKENPIPINQVEEEKQKFIENLQSEGEEEEEQSEETTEAPSITNFLNEMDYADIYVGLFSFISNFIYKVNIYEYPEFIDRLKRRGKLLQKIIERYVADEDTMAMVILGFDTIDDFFFMLTLIRKEKDKEKEKKEGEKQ